jgi:hypothetical protein
MYGSARRTVKQPPDCQMSSTCLSPLQPLQQTMITLLAARSVGLSTESRNRECRISAASRMHRKRLPRRNKTARDPRRAAPRGCSCRGDREFLAGARELHNKSAGEVLLLPWREVLDVHLVGRQMFGRTLERAEHRIGATTIEIRRLRRGLNNRAEIEELSAGVIPMPPAIRTTWPPLSTSSKLLRGLLIFSVCSTFIASKKYFESPRL